MKYKLQKVYVFADVVVLDVVRDGVVVGSLTMKKNDLVDMLIHAWHGDITWGESETKPVPLDLEQG